MFEHSSSEVTPPVRSSSASLQQISAGIEPFKVQAHITLQIRLRSSHSRHELWQRPSLGEVAKSHLGSCIVRRYRAFEPVCMTVRSIESFGVSTLAIKLPWELECDSIASYVSLWLGREDNRPVCHSRPRMLSTPDIPRTAGIGAKELEIYSHSSSASARFILSQSLRC